MRELISTRNLSLQVEPQHEAPVMPDWLSLDPLIMVKAAACLTTAYEKAALRLTCKQWKWVMDQAVKEVPMILGNPTFPA